LGDVEPKMPIHGFFKAIAMWRRPESLLIKILEDLINAAACFIVVLPKAEIKFGFLELDNRSDKFPFGSLLPNKITLAWYFFRIWRIKST
jgi:hypothetical protein